MKYLHSIEEGKGELKKKKTCLLQICEAVDSKVGCNRNGMDLLPMVDKLLHTLGMKKGYYCIIRY